MDLFVVLFWVAIGIPIFTSLLYLGGRYRLRHLMRDVRQRKIGDLVWMEMVFENSRREARQGFKTSDFRGIYAFTETIKTSLPYWSRGIISFVWYRDENGMLHLYIGMDEGHAGDLSVFRSLGASLDAKPTKIASLPPLPSGGLTIASRSRVTPSFVENEVQSVGAAADAFHIAADELPHGETAAFIVTADMVRSSESKRLESNIAEEAIMRGGSSNEMQGTARNARILADKAVRVSLAAGNSTNSTSVSKNIIINCINSISTFGWEIKTFVPGRKAPQSAILAAVAALGLLALFTMVGLFSNIIIPVVLALPYLALLGMAVSRPDELALAPFKHRFALGEVVVPPYVYWSLRWRIRSIMRSQRGDAGGDHKVGNRIAEPSTAQVMYMHGAALFELLTTSYKDNINVNVDTTQSRGLPSNILHADWPLYLGRSGANQQVCFDLSDLQFGMYTAGTPGSGKTNFLQVIYAGAVKTSLEKYAGLQVTPIWGETKGEGAVDAWDIARRHPQAMLIEAHNPNNPLRLALEGRRISDGASVKDVIRSTIDLVSGFQFAWGDGIRSASREMLDHAFRIAHLLSPSEIKEVGLEDIVDPDLPNIMDLGFYLLGGDTQIDVGATLLDMYEDLKESKDEREFYLAKSISTMSRFFDKRTRKSMEQQISAPLNKISELRNASVAWTPSHDRKDIVVSDLPTHFAPIVVNMGPYQNEFGEFDMSIPDSVSRRLILIFNYLMWTHVKSACTGWLQQGKRVPMFFDEVVDIAVNSENNDVPNVLAQALKEGRSKGISFYIGSQSPSQMPAQARQEVLSLRSKFWFSLHQPDDLELAAKDLASSDSDQPYSPQAIRSLPDGTCLGIMKRKRSITPPFTLHVPYAPKWAEILLAPGLEIQDAIAEYAQWADMQESHKL